MIWSLDSSLDAPSQAQAQAAKAAGIGFWWGYLATRPGVGLLAPWPREAFWNVQQAGLGCGAFVSGWDDPVALRQLAAEWGIPLLGLDDEDAIRPLTSPDWRPAFLQAANAGLYGLLARHTIPARFRIAALYPAGGCSGATWPVSPPPPEPRGWQCQGTHTEFGLSVDRAALDDWFGGFRMTQGQLEEMVDSWYWTLLGRPVENDAARQGWVARILPDGSNARLVRDQFAATDEAVTYGRQVAALKAGTLGGPSDTALRDYLRATPAS